VRLYAATGNAVVRLDPIEGGWQARAVLREPGAYCLAVDPADPDRVYAGLREGGIRRSDDGGERWEPCGLADDAVYSLAVSAADGALYAGTEPSRLFVAPEGGSWTELEALQEIPSRPSWSFPPRPWTHHVRWIAPDPHRAERLLVGIELGGLMLSEDGGLSFSDHRSGAKRDTHSIAWHPRRPDRAYQAAGDGAAWSHDGGRTWEAADAGRELPYCWALAVDPSDPELWYVSAATGPGAAHGGEGAKGRLYRWNGGWEALPLPGDSMPYALAVSDGELIVGTADGRIISSGDAGESWEDLGVRVGSVLAMAVG
jgi:photosystem II stability/assembly factor-like uncharacterized protein